MDPQKVEARTVANKITQVLSDAEIATLAEDLNLSGKVTRNAISDSLNNLPRYEIVRIVLKAAHPTLLLLRDIFDILGQFGIAARTTGCIFSLANPTNTDLKSELEFSPQAIGTICTWNPKQNWKPLSTSLTELKATWQHFRPVWLDLLDNARPVHHRGRIDAVQTFIHNRLVREPDSEYIDEEAQRVFEFFVPKLNALAEALNTIPAVSIPPELTWILRGIKELLAEAREILPERGFYGRKRAPTESEMRRHVSKQFILDFDKFQEDIYLLSNLTEGERLFDMLRLDVWSTRPQLYEIWVMLTLLRWLSQRGYRIKILKTSARSSGSAFRWDLSYTKDSTPCAVVRDPNSRSIYLFYQLYRPSGDMPDLSMLDGPAPDSAPIWSVDPKHSEKGRYTMSYYQRTAERYRDSFGAPRSIIAEYFPRKERRGENPVCFSEGAILVHDCRPEGAGLELLFEELSVCHPSYARVLVCVDVSSSFLPQLPAALSRLREEVLSNATAGSYLDEYVCFAGSAECQTGLTAWLGGSQDLSLPSNLTPGTQVSPLEEAIISFISRIPVSHIVVLSDGEFDSPLNTMIERIEKAFQITVSLYS